MTGDPETIMRGRAATVFRETVMAAGTGQRPPTKVVSGCHPKLKSIGAGSGKGSARNTRHSFPWYTDV